MNLCALFDSAGIFHGFSVMDSSGEYTPGTDYKSAVLAYWRGMEDREARPFDMTPRAAAPARGKRPAKAAPKKKAKF